MAADSFRKLAQRGSDKLMGLERVRQSYKYREGQTVLQVQRGSNSLTDTERIRQFYRYRKGQTVLQILKG